MRQSNEQQQSEKKLPDEEDRVSIQRSIFFQTTRGYGHHSDNSGPPTGNSVDKEPGRTRDEASCEDQDIEARQSFPMGSIDSTMGESSPSRGSRLWLLFKKSGVVAFHYSTSNPL